MGKKKNTRFFFTYGVCVCERERGLNNRGRKCVKVLLSYIVMSTDKNMVMPLNKRKIPLHVKFIGILVVIIILSSLDAIITAENQLGLGGGGGERTCSISFRPILDSK